MTNKSKRRVRDIQEQTGWPYTAALFIVRELGYGVVSEAVDACPVDVQAYEALREKLAAQARDVQRARPKESP
jgi:hypothetical protein